MTQADALTILKTGANVFLTGEPGAGKSHTVNQYTAYLRSCGVEPVITASTGIAATHIGGSTIHSWSGIGISKWLDPYTLDRIASNERTVKRVRQAKVLIIDEVSMLSPDTLAMVDAVCREIRKNYDAFGGLQVVLVGDFFQLPPIQSGQPSNHDLFSQSPQPAARFAYESPAWKRLNPVVCYLTEQHRQSDAVFLELLSAIRANTFAENHHDILQTRIVDSTRLPADAPKLYTHNIDVDRVNQEALRALPGEVKTFAMTTRGPKPLIESMQKSCLSPETLQLKVGASVMFTKNNPQENYVNGTLGTVISFADNGYPEVKTRDGRTLVVSPVEWNMTEQNRVLAQLVQLPLRLAWAITVHKSQGMSLDEAVMDLRSVFEYGQGYVAISRVRSLAGVHLLGYNQQALQVHPSVLAEDELFRVSSTAAEQTFGKVAAEELKTMVENFIRACGGVVYDENAPKATESEPVKKTWMEKIREKSANAYRRWSESEEEKLVELFNNNESIKKIAEALGRKPGGIRARLIKMGLIEENAID